MLRLHRLFKLIESLPSNRRIKTHDHVRSRSIRQERMLICSQLRIGPHIRHHSIQPRDPTERMVRIWQWPIMGNLRRLERSQHLAIVTVNMVANQLLADLPASDLIRDTTCSNHHLRRIKTNQDPISHDPIRVPIETRIDLHASQQIASRRTRIRLLQDRQRRISEHIARTTRRITLKREASLREYERSNVNTRCHDRILRTIQSTHRRIAMTVRLILDPVIREIVEHGLIVGPRQRSVTDLRLTITQNTSQHQRSPFSSRSRATPKRIKTRPATTSPNQINRIAAPATTKRPPRTSSSRANLSLVSPMKPTNLLCFSPT